VVYVHWDVPEITNTNDTSGDTMLKLVERASVQDK
jgi:hypothetical protein